MVSSATQLDAIGVLAAAGAACFSASGLVLTRRWGSPAPLLTLTAWQLSWGGVALLPMLLLIEDVPHTLTPSAWLGLAWLIGPSTIGGYLLWFDGIRRLAPSAVAGLGMLSPLMAAALGWVVLDQSMTLLQLASAAVALGGILGLQQAATSTAKRELAIAATSTNSAEAAMDIDVNPDVEPDHSRSFPADARLVSSRTALC